MSYNSKAIAGVMELADVLDSKSNGTVTLDGNTWNGKADAEMNWDGSVLK